MKYFQGWLLVLGWSLSDLWGYSNRPTFIRRRSTGWSLNDWLRCESPHPLMTLRWSFKLQSQFLPTWKGWGALWMGSGLMFNNMVVFVWCLFNVFFWKMEGLKRSICQGLYQVSTDLCLFAVGGFKTTFHLVIYVGKNRFDKFMSIPFFRRNVLEAAALAILQNLRSLKLSTASASATAKLTELEVPQKKAPTMAHGHENSNIISIWGRCVQIRCLLCWITQVTLPCKLSYELFVPRGCVLRNTL